MRTQKQTHVGKLLSRYAGHLQDLPDFVLHLPVYVDYNVKLDAIAAGLDEPLYTREFLRYLLIDQKLWGSGGEDVPSIAEVEAKLGYESGSLNSNLFTKHTPKERVKELPNPLQSRLEALTGKTGFWHKPVFMASEARDIKFNMNADLTDVIKTTNIRGGFVSATAQKPVSRELH